MKFGIRWYEGEGVHDYKEVGFSERSSLMDLLKELHWYVVEQHGHSEDHLFDALDAGRQDSIYWVTDNFGFAFYLPD
jgi:hypothetical protein